MSITWNVTLTDTQYQHHSKVLGNSLMFWPGNHIPPPGYVMCSSSLGSIVDIFPTNPVPSTHHNGDFGLIFTLAPPFYSHFWLRLALCDADQLDH